MMAMKRMAALALALILILGALPAALATPSTAGCPKSQDGNHGWMPRPRDAWCEWSGGMVYVCRYCGKEAFEETTPALGHNWSEWMVTKKATCTSKGSKTRTCSRCNKVETQSIPTTGHAYSAWGVIVQPTCETAGEQAHVCASCGRTETKPVTPLGHKWDGGKVTKMPTATEDGVLTYTCKNDPSHTKTEAIPATGGEPTAEGHPSLFVFVQSDASISSEESGSSWSTYVAIKLSVTNNGDIPLLVKGPGCYDILQPDETHTTILHELIKKTSEGGGSESADIDKIVYTPENPLYYGYVTFGVTEYGYDPDGIIEDPLCASNEGGLTIWFPRNIVPPDLPALSLKKSYAAPKNGEYFTAGEPIHWILTVTNTTEAPITDVTVTDKGVNVGSFSEIAPAETVTCSVPDHIVTGYEADVVGYVKNAAVAEGKDADGHPHNWPSNEATAPAHKAPDKEGDPLLTKAEAHPPANGEYYRPGEAVDYVITVKNTGDATLTDMILTDSLAGFTPIATLDSLAPGAMKTFTYTYTVQESDAAHPFLVNSAILTYSIGGVSGTPQISTVYSKLQGTDPAGFDPDLLPRDGESCRQTLDALGAGEARYTLHTCAEHLPAAQVAEAAAQAGDWDQAAGIWRGELEKLYGILYLAGDSEARSAVMGDRVFFDTYLKRCAAAGAGAYEVEALRLKCATLCCAIHTMPEDLPDSIAGQYTALNDGEKHKENGREIAGLAGNDCKVVERFDSTGALALNDTVRLAAGEDRATAFSRGATLWQMALDEILAPVYEGAGKERKRAITAWRKSLDSLPSAARRLLTLMYSGNRAMIEEQLMNVYKDAVLCVEKLR